MSLRVMTYNILDGGEGRESHILEVIRTSKPDVVILQEIFTEEFLQFLSQALGMKYCMGTGNRKRKVALLSKLPVLSFKSYHPKFLIWNNFIDAQIEYESNKAIRIIGVHLIPNLGVLFEIWRYWEAKYVVNHIKKYPDERCLLAGDFNAIAPGEITRTENMPARLRWTIYLQGNRVYHFSIGLLLSAGLTDCYRLLNSDDGLTLPPPKPNARLDYIFANTELKPYLEKCWVVREPNVVDLASDHYPVMAEFTFKKQFL